MDFVDFDLAKKLKEKGFDEECLAYYTSEYTLYTNKVVLCDDKYLEIAVIDYEECLCSYNTQKDGLISTIVDAPTISQVLKWLREEKKIYVSVEVEREDWFEYKIVQTIKNARCNGTRVYETYDDAMLAGIEYVLNNLI